MMGGRLGSFNSLTLAIAASDEIFMRMPRLDDYGHSYGYRSESKQPSKAKRRRRAKAKAAGKARSITKRSRP